MAAQIREIKISWENDDSFKLETQLDSGGWQTIIEMDENGYFSNLWEEGVAPLCKHYFEDVINDIGAEMKA